MPPRATRIVAGALLAAALAGCYPRYDFRDVRPDCARAWCGFVASFPGRVTSATRDVPVGSARVPLSLHVVSVGDVTFAVGAFDLTAGVDAAAAQALLERKLIDDVGGAGGRRGTAVIQTRDRAAVDAVTLDVAGQKDGRPMRAVARFARRSGRLVEQVVLGPAGDLDGGAGGQAIETFFTSLRLD